MDTERRWFMVKLLIARHEVTIVIPGNLPPYEIQYIKETIESAIHAQEYSHEPINLDGLLPDINYITTPLILDDVEAEERQNLSVQIFHPDPVNLDTSVPEAAYSAMPLALGGIALEEELDQLAQELHTDSDISDTFVPNVDQNEASLTLNVLIIIEESNFHNPPPYGSDHYS
jgi:hypothetical protein